MPMFRNKNESRFSRRNDCLFYFEFNADSEYIILFEKYHGPKDDLTSTCSF
jgi:hypothetical protein